MASYIKIFFAEDETQVEPFGNGVGEPVEFSLRADLNEVGTPIRLYALADDGYVITPVPPAESIFVTPVSEDGTYDKWALAPDAAGPLPGEWGAYGATLNIGAEVNDTDKVYFWVKAKATDDEEPAKDYLVALEVEGIAAVE